MVYGQQKNEFLGDFEEDIKYIDSIKKKAKHIPLLHYSSSERETFKKCVSDTCRDSNTGM